MRELLYLKDVGLGLLSFLLFRFNIGYNEGPGMTVGFKIFLDISMLICMIQMFVYLDCAAIEFIEGLIRKHKEKDSKDLSFGPGRKREGERNV